MQVGCGPDRVETGVGHGQVRRRRQSIPWLLQLQDKTKPVVVGHHDQAKHNPSKGVSWRLGDEYQGRPRFVEGDSRPRRLLLSLNMLSDYVLLV